jgi:hypothetical protein
MIHNGDYQIPPMSSQWQAEVLERGADGAKLLTDDGFHWDILPEDRPIARGWMLAEKVTIRHAGRGLAHNFELTDEDGRTVRANIAQPAAGNARMTSREAQVFFLAANGLTTEEIAPRMKLTHGTVRDIIWEISLKLRGW